MASHRQQDRLSGLINNKISDKIAVTFITVAACVQLAGKIGPASATVGRVENQ
jgi:hypothetical protein